MSFNNVRDVLHIRSIERTILRPLTDEEYDQIDNGEIFFVQLPNGEWRSEKVERYTLFDLMPGHVNERFEPAKNEKDSSEREISDDEQLGFFDYAFKDYRPVVIQKLSPKEIEHNKKVKAFLKKHGFVDLEDEFGNLPRQEFSQNKEHIEYFANLTECLNDLNRKGIVLPPTDNFIMWHHAFEGRSDGQISRMLKGKEGKEQNLKPYSKQTVGERKDIIVKELGIKPIVFRH